MIVLGIDPGTSRVGYGAVESGGGAVKLVGAGLMSVRGGDHALRDIKTETDRLIKELKPELVAIERLFFSKNQKTGIAVAEARGVILLAAKESGVEVKEYTPNELKAGITGYGSASKYAVQKMVKLILNEPGLRVLDDASDALALAIVAVGRRVLDSR